MHLYSPLLIKSENVHKSGSLLKSLILEEKNWLDQEMNKLKSDY